MAAGKLAGGGLGKHPMKFSNSAIGGCSLALVVLFAVILSDYGHLSPLLLLPGLVALGITVCLAIRMPQLFLAAAAFAPQWKGTWPLSGLNGVADLTLVMLGCVCISICWRILKHLGRIDSLGLRELFRGQSRVMLAFALFVAVVAISDSYTTAPEYGSSKLFRLLGIGTLLLLSPVFLIRTEQEFRRFLRMFVVFAGITVMQLAGGLQAPSADADVTRIGAGWLVGMAAIIVVFYPLSNSEAHQRLLMVVSLPILVAGLIASVARGPMVALSVILGIRLVLWFKEGKQALAAALAFLFALSGASAFLVVRHAGNNKYANKANELIRLAEGEDNRGSAATRVLFYKAAFSAIPDHPVLGRGVGSWSVFYYGSDQRAYPHNMLVEVAFEQGLIGLLALLFLFGAVYSSLAWLCRRTRGRYSVMGFLILYCLIVAMFSGDLDDNRLLWMWCGMTMALCRNVQLQRLASACQKASTLAGAAVRARGWAHPSWLHS